MINGLGVVGWGVGGIEAEAAMLGLPVASLCLKSLESPYRQALMRGYGHRPYTAYYRAAA